jgi:hypothetical protein
LAEAPQRLVVNVDGGARGNPGPAAIAAVIQSPAGEVLEEHGERIGEATNNVAEYRRCCWGSPGRRRWVQKRWSWSVTPS